MGLIEIMRLANVILGRTLGFAVTLFCVVLYGLVAGSTLLFRYRSEYRLVVEFVHSHRRSVYVESSTTVEMMGTVVAWLIAAAGQTFPRSGAAKLEIRISPRHKQYGRNKLEFEKVE